MVDQDLQTNKFMNKYILQRQLAGTDEWFDVAEYFNAADARNAQWSAWVAESQTYHNIPEELDSFRVVETHA